MQCSHCKAVIPDTAKFCSKCGTKISARLCPNGHVLDEGSDICKYCPPATNPSRGTVAASTTIEKTTTIEKPTTLESPKVPSTDKTTVLEGTRVYTAREPEPTRLMGWLVITEGKNQWKDFKVMKPQLTVGRAQDCDIVLDDVHVSSRHASLRLIENSIYITDLDSSNGTYVNGQEITKTALKDNDIIKMGDAVLKFKAF
jgi:hypothetical protein